MIQSLVVLFVLSSILSIARLFVRPFAHSFNRSLVRSPFRPFFQSLAHSSFFRLFFQSLTYSFVLSPILSIARSFVRSFAHSIARSLVRRFFRLVTWYILLGIKKKTFFCPCARSFCALYLSISPANYYQVRMKNIESIEHLLTYLLLCSPIITNQDSCYRLTEMLLLISVYVLKRNRSRMIQ